MKPASGPRDGSDAIRLLSVDASGERIDHRRFTELPALVEPGDLVVVNDAATAPAAVTFDLGGDPVELRLLRSGTDADIDAIVLGTGDRTMATERRGDPRFLRKGAVLRRGGLALRVVGTDAESPRHARLRFDGVAAHALEALYEEGQVVQYSYVPEALELWDVQTTYAGRPWASEMPSAGRPLTFEMIDALRRRGVEVTRITHGAGLSSSGDEAVDRQLPFRERYLVDRTAADAIGRARVRGNRIVAVGTTVVRALESAARSGAGAVGAGHGVTDLRLDARTPLLVCSALLTGMHEAGTSHFELLSAFAEPALLTRAVVEATEAGYLAHEFGDSMLLKSAPRADGRNSEPRFRIAG